MKIRTVLLTIASFILAGALIYSCEKDLPLDNPEPEMSALKAKPVKNTPMEQLGKEIFFDEISDPDTPEGMSCATCHPERSGFSSPLPWINLQAGIMPGAVPERFGNRKVPSAAYATFSPVLYYDVDEELYIGGNFWDGRATGETLGSPAAEQALGPFLNPVEHNNASIADVLQTIANSDYVDLWEAVWGEPISLDPADAARDYDRVGLAIAAYEASSGVNQFSSKFDLYLAGEVDLTQEELDGLALFDGKGQCALCHPSTIDGANPPLFTDFSYDNLGTPKNPDNPFYLMDQVFLDDGSPINPDGAAWIDPGLGGFLESVGLPFAEQNMGKHKVPTLRNVGKMPNSLPKAYMHNGVFKSLKEVVHFYNTRDVESWPPPEVPENVNTDELGNLGLSDAEEDAIVAFMLTLSDGYINKPVKK